MWSNVSIYLSKSVSIYLSAIDLGDGVLIFSREEHTNPEKFVFFAENLAQRIRLLNSGETIYLSSPFSIKFTMSIDYGSDIYLFNDRDPQGGADTLISQWVLNNLEEYVNKIRWIYNEKNRALQMQIRL